MHEIELFGDGYDGGRVMAWMLFPSDHELRESHVHREIAIQACNEAGPNESISIAPHTLRALVNGPGKLEIGKLAVEATKRGTVAGDLINLVYEMHARSTEEPSMEKAIDNYKHFAPGVKYGDGEALKYSRQTLRNYFHEFQSVAHLWGAFRMNQGPYAFTDDARDVFHSEAALMKFLGVAKGLQDFISTFVPKRAKPPLPIVELSDLIEIPANVAAITLKFKQRTARPV